jgi:hypothetical protein
MFNRIQENLLRGGLKDESRRRDDGKQVARMRALTGLAGLDRNVRLNKELWNLAQRAANGEALSFAIQAGNFCKVFGNLWEAKKAVSIHVSRAS